MGCIRGLGGVALGFLGCVRGACAGHWAGWACRGAWGCLRWVCAVSGSWVRGRHVLLFGLVVEARMEGQ